MGIILQKSRTGFLNPANSTVDGLIAASNGLMCLKNAIFGLPLNPAALLQSLATVAATMILSITASVTKIIYKRVYQIVDSALSPLRKIEGIIIDLTIALEDAQFILDKATNMDNYFKDKQNCASMGANLLNCLAQSAIDKITDKVTMEVDKHAGKIADSVSKQAFGTNSTIDSFVGRQAKFIDKAQLQTKLLT
jgi:hypothetical protein